MNELTEEEKKIIKDNIEKFKIKIHWELDNSDDDVLIFGNNRVATATGDMRKVLFKLACIIDQMSIQSGHSRKSVLKGIKEAFKLVDIAKSNTEE